MGMTNSSNSIRLKRMSDRAKSGIASFASYWGQGVIKNSKSGYELKSDLNSDLNSESSSVPVQSRVMAYWPDGSVKWVSHVADSEKAGDNCVIKVIDNTDITDGIKITEESDLYKIKFADGELTILKSGTTLIENYIRNGKKIINKAWSELVLQHREGCDEDDEAVYRNEKFIGKIEKYFYL